MLSPTKSSVLPSRLVRKGPNLIAVAGGLRIECDGGILPVVRFPLSLV